MDIKNNDGVKGSKTTWTKLLIHSSFLQIWCLSHILVTEYAVMARAERLKKGWEDDPFSVTFLGLVLISKQYKRFRLASPCTKRRCPYDWTLTVGVQLMFPSKFTWKCHSGFNHNLSKLLNWEKKNVQNLQKTKWNMTSYGFFFHVFEEGYTLSWCFW